MDEKSTAAADLYVDNRIFAANLASHPIIPIGGVTHR